MSASTTPNEAAPEAVRVGSFIVSKNAGAGTSAQVIGAPDTPFAGRPGLLTRVAVGDTPDALAAAEVKLAKLRHLSHPALVQVLECGLADTTASWVYPEHDGVPITEARKSDPDLGTILGVQSLITTIGGALQIVHSLGLSHGSIGADTVVVRSDDTVALTGLGIVGKGYANDQADLARLAISLLADRPWVDPETEPDNSAGPSAARAQRLRDSLGNYTERVSNVLAKASDLDPADRYPSIAEFVGQFTAAVQASADDLVQAAFEAISARSPELAQLVADKAALYDPANANLALLRLQLSGGSPFGMASAGPVIGSALESPLPAVPLPPVQPLSPPTSGQAVASMLPPELTEGLPPEFLETIAPQFAAKPVKKGLHPLFVIAMGGAGVIFLLAIAGMATFLLGGD